MSVAIELPMVQCGNQEEITDFTSSRTDTKYEGGSFDGKVSTLVRGNFSAPAWSQSKKKV